MLCMQFFEVHHGNNSAFYLRVSLSVMFHYVACVQMEVSKNHIVYKVLWDLKFTESLASSLYCNS